MFRYAALFFYAILLCVSPLSALRRGWNDEGLVSAYFHSSEMQRHWALDLVGRNPLLGSEEVLDFGCGDGKITAILSHFLPEGQVLKKSWQDVTV